MLARQTKRFRLRAKSFRKKTSHPEAPQVLIVTALPDVNRESSELEAYEPRCESARTPHSLPGRVDWNLTFLLDGISVCATRLGPTPTLACMTLAIRLPHHAVQAIDWTVRFWAYSRNALHEAAVRATSRCSSVLKQVKKGVDRSPVGPDKLGL